MPLTRSIRPALPLAISWLLVLPATGFQVRDKATTPKATNIESEEPKEPTLRMTPAVVCLSIDGYEQFEELPGAALTSDEKLLVYFKPLRYKVVSKGDDYVARFTQDAQIRRRGQKAVLLRKKMILDYEAKSRRPPDQIYLRNTFSLKGLSPGEYEYDIILRDEYEPGLPAIQSVKFRIILPTDPRPPKDAG